VNLRLHPMTHDRPTHRSHRLRQRLLRSWFQWPWDSILVVLGCVVLGARLTGVFPTIAAPQPGLPAVPVSPAMSPLPLVQPPLSTRGAEIIDAQGKVVLLRGVNWFGIETENHAPHGLWARDYKEMLAQIKGLGYNFIRLPYSVQALRDTKVSGIDYRIGSNRELEGKTPIEVMDAIVAEAGRQGLMILLDSHRLNNKRIPELWYGDGFTEGDWIRAWAILAERYRNQPNVIGADLKNEPHGIASWGTGDRRTDWRLAAERAGNTIHKINPNWLIIVEGVEWNVPGQKLPKHWMGGNLEGVRRFPVRLQQPHKVVYSPHEYGPGVFSQKWFKAPQFPQNLYDRWDQGFFYIAREGIAPVLIGEFGGKKFDQDSKEGQWQNLFVDFINQHQLSYAYWSWNPNSRDTGGILKDDWKTVQQGKQSMLNRTLPVMAMAPMPGQINSTGSYQPKLVVPVASPSPKPSPTPVVKTGKLDQLSLKTILQSEWQTGFCWAIEVTNNGSLPVQQWQLQFDMPKATIDQKWNAEYQAQGSQYNAIPADWGKSIQPKQTINFGFCANKQGADAKAQNFRITGRNP
jgi:endoglucanase